MTGENEIIVEKNSGAQEGRLGAGRGSKVKNRKLVIRMQSDTLAGNMPSCFYGCDAHIHTVTCV